MGDSSERRAKTAIAEVIDNKLAMYFFCLLTLLAGGMLRMTESCKPAGITTTTTTSAVPGVIITGGSPFSSVGVKVEVFNIKTKKTCQLADLPGGEGFLHSQCGHLLCGG